VIYENGTLSRILIDGGYITMSGTIPTYHYDIQDHLGNNRVVFNQSGTVEQANHYYPFGMTFGEGTENSDNRYKYNGKELDRMHGLDLYDYGARHYDAAIGRWGVIDPLAEKYYSVSPYVYCANNPIRFVDPDGTDVYLFIWASYDGRVGHAGIAVDNYRTEKVKDRNGNIVVDKNGDPVTRQVKDDTVTYSDLWPANKVGKMDVDQNVGALFNKKVTTLNKLRSTDTGNEGRSPDGIVKLKTDASTDELVNLSLSSHEIANSEYNGLNNNCSDYAKAGIEYAVPGRIHLGNTEEQFESIKITTPNQLYNASVNLPNASIIRNPGNKTNTNFKDAISGNILKRLVVFFKEP